MDVTHIESKMDELWDLIDHIEVVHERELGRPYNFTRLIAIHEDMHKRNDSWDHLH